MQKARKRRVNERMHTLIYVPKPCIGRNEISVRKYHHYRIFCDPNSLYFMFRWCTIQVIKDGAACRGSIVSHQ